MSRRWLARRSALSLWFAGLLVATAAQSQGGPWLAFDLGALEGRASDPTGAPLVGANVRLRGPIERAVRAGPGGRFFFPALVPGRYSVEVSREGFVTSVVEDIDVEPGGVLYLRFELVPGRASSLTVTSMPVIDTTRSSGREHTGRSELDLLPLRGVIAGLDALLPPPRGPRLFDGLEVGGRHRVSIWDHLAVALVEGVALATSDPGAGLDFVAAPARLLARRVQAPWHASLGVLSTGPALAEHPATVLSGRRATLRPNASFGGQWGDRLVGFVGGGFDRETFDAETFDTGTSETESAHQGHGLSEPKLRLDTRLGLGRLDGQPSRSWRLGALYLGAHGRGSDGRPDVVERLARLDGVGVPAAGIEVGIRLARADRSGVATLVQPLGDESRTGFQFGWSRGIQVLSVGAAHQRQDRGLWFEGGSRTALWVQERLRLGRVNLQLGLRAQDHEGSMRGLSKTASDDGQELLPRAGVSWDLLGDGQWSLFANAGEYGESAVGWDEARSIAKPRRTGIGLRHQLIPGVVLEAEASRRRVAAAVVDDPDSTATPGPEHIRLDTVRLGARAALGRRATTTMEYQRFELTAPPLLGEARDRRLDASQLVLTATWALERGFEAGTVVRYRQGGFWARAQAWPALQTQAVAEPRFDFDQQGSLAEVAIALGYRLPIQPDAEQPLRATLRLEVSNLLDDRLEDRDRPDPEARRVWLGFRIER